MTPITPPELADELGHIETRKGLKVRNYLRKTYPEHKKGERWHLSPEQADDVRSHFAR
ncbi:hypothetical protein AB0N73_06000 [Microbacterium sp. NPDC089189]|uniref:hypothetical protein n=1 Tax=Microbacterium sp. NPDC089189 TaxID=3154972 RepID=UPI00341A5A4E